MEKKIISLFRAFFILASIGLIGSIFYFNFAPLGAYKKFSTDPEIANLTLEPKDRILETSYKNNPVWKQGSDYIYFNVDMPYRFEKAKAKITFKNLSKDQGLSLGFKDKESWSYQTKLIDANPLNDLSWTFVGDNPRLYQKNPNYSSFQEFLQNPPENSIIGFYNFDSNYFKQTYLPDYSPSNSETTIEIPLRGKVVLYAYVNNEPFIMKISKQDLNWYEDPDIVSIKIYKDRDVVYQASISDDSITDSSRDVLPPEEVSIQNPGPGLPETGIYKVVIDAGSDSIITSIKTNLHKIIFDSPLYLASNSEIYPKVIAKTKENKLYTDALAITAQTLHEPSLQEIKIDNQTLKLNMVKKEEATNLTNEVSEITIPKSDLILKSLLGYFAFSKDQLFKPSKYKLLPITKKEDIDLTDFIVTNYHPSRAEGDWRIAEAEFDLSEAVTKKGGLSWIIKSPGLKEEDGEILIKNIELELTKKPLIKL